MSKKKFVIKLGTSSLTKGTKNLSRRNMLEFARQITQLHDVGHEVILVTSGAIAAGREVLGQPKIERSLPAKQMLAAVGQVQLMHIWSELFAFFEIPVAQILLTRDDFSNRQRYLNVRDTLFSLMSHRIIPIINENDSVATGIMKLGDNDNLSASVANLVAAHLLILLTDQEGLYTADPRTDPHAKLISEVKKIDDSIISLAKGPSGIGLGTGGFVTKIQAARLASQSGTSTVIASSSIPNVLTSLAEGRSIGTKFFAETTPKESRKRWLLSESRQGTIYVDAGAEKQLHRGGASLLPVGITRTLRSFERGAIVEIVSAKNVPIAVGMSNYSSSEIEKLIGKQSDRINDILGYNYGPEVIHRDNMTILAIEEGTQHDR